MNDTAPPPSSHNPIRSRVKDLTSPEKHQPACLSTPPPASDKAPLSWKDPTSLQNDSPLAYEYSHPGLHLPSRWGWGFEGHIDKLCIPLDPALQATPSRIHSCCHLSWGAVLSLPLGPAHQLSSPFKPLFLLSPCLANSSSLSRP